MSRAFRFAAREMNTDLQCPLLGAGAEGAHTGGGAGSANERERECFDKGNVAHAR